MSPAEVKAIRLELGFTQAELAGALELAEATGKDTVRSWESGKREPSGPVRVALRMLRDQAPRPPASLHDELTAAFHHSDRLVAELGGKNGRTLAKETRDRIRAAMEAAALLESVTGGN